MNKQQKEMYAKLKILNKRRKKPAAVTAPDPSEEALNDWINSEDRNRAREESQKSST